MHISRRAGMTKAGSYRHVRVWSLAVAIPYHCDMMTRTHILVQHSSIQAHGAHAVVMEPMCWREGRCIPGLTVLPAENT
eukprot:1161563-Pelagomonas_calceolata.AAC.10